MTLEQASHASRAPDLVLQPATGSGPRIITEDVDADLPPDRRLVAGQEGVHNLGRHPLSLLTNAAV